jgi:hypothetical protein
VAQASPSSGRVAHRRELKEALKPYGETAKDALAYLDVKETSERFVNFSLCAPSRSSLLTGETAHNHGIKSNKGTKGGG